MAIFSFCFIKADMFIGLIKVYISIFGNVANIQQLNSRCRELPITNTRTFLKPKCFRKRNLFATYHLLISQVPESHPTSHFPTASTVPASQTASRDRRRPHPPVDSGWQRDRTCWISPAPSSPKTGESDDPFQIVDLRFSIPNRRVLPEPQQEIEPLSHGDAEIFPFVLLRDSVSPWLAHLAQSQTQIANG